MNGCRTKVMERVEKVTENHLAHLLANPNHGALLRPRGGWTKNKRTTSCTRGPRPRARSGTTTALVMGAACSRFWIHQRRGEQARRVVRRQQQEQQYF